MNHVRVSAPVRVDLAGGSLDLWPTGLLVEEAVTVNCAVSLAASVECFSSKNRGVRLVSRDIDADYFWVKGNKAGPLPLLEKLCAAIGVTDGFTLKTSSDAPPGSGLGGSSAMALSVATALLSVKGESLPNERVVAICRDVEAELLRIPTGVQDFWPAVMGGVLSIHYPPGGEVIDRIPVPLKDIASRMIVCYSGRSRLSSGTNWSIVKRFIDGNRDTVDALTGLSEAANGVLSALLKGDLDKVGLFIDREWSFRRKLAPGISTPSLEAILECGRRAGATGGKACGAGGGGCLLLWTEPDNRERIEQALQKEGALLLTAHPVENGVILEEL